MEKVSFRGFDEENVILQNAIKELETGISGMLSLKPSISFEESLTDGLQIVKSADTPAEGYKIEEKEGLLSLFAVFSPKKPATDCTSRHSVAIESI